MKLKRPNFSCTSTSQAGRGHRGAKGVQGLGALFLKLILPLMLIKALVNVGGFGCTLHAKSLLENFEEVLPSVQVS